MTSVFSNKKSRQKVYSSYKNTISGDKKKKEKDGPLDFNMNINIFKKETPK